MAIDIKVEMGALLPSVFHLKPVEGHTLELADLRKWAANLTNKIGVRTEIRTDNEGNLYMVIPQFTDNNCRSMNGQVAKGGSMTLTWLEYDDEHATDDYIDKDGIMWIIYTVEPHVANI